MPVRKSAAMLAMFLAGTASVASAGPPDEATATGGLQRTPAGAAQDLPAPLPLLTLYVFDVHGLMDSSFADITRETGGIFQEMGVDITWRRGALGTVYGGGPLREIPVILLKEPPGSFKSNVQVLGLVPKGQPTAIWIFVENVRRTLSLSMTEAISPRVLAIAVGRVIAHEIVHSLAPEFAHTKRGLMRHALDRNALVGSARPSHSKCVGAVRAALKLDVPVPPPADLVVLPFPPGY